MAGECAGTQTRICPRAHWACQRGQRRDPGEGRAVAHLHVGFLVSGRVRWVQPLLIRLHSGGILGSSFLPCLLRHTVRLSKCQGCW